MKVKLFVSKDEENYAEIHVNNLTGNVKKAIDLLENDKQILEDTSVFAARRGKEVLILERQDTLGKKLLGTGNGRCNLSNENLSEKNSR